MNTDAGSQRCDHDRSKPGRTVKHVDPKASARVEDRSRRGIRGTRTGERQPDQIVTGTPLDGAGLQREAMAVPARLDPIGSDLDLKIIPLPVIIAKRRKSWP